MGKNIIKKFIQIIILLFVIMTVFFSVVKANTSESMQLRIEKNKDIKQIKLILDVNKIDTGALGLQGTLNFDKELLEFKEAKINDENWRITALNEENGKFVAEINDEVFFNAEEYLYEKEGFMEFIFNDLGEVDNYDISLVDIKLVDSTFETVEMEDLILQTKSNKNIIILVIFILVIIFLFIIKKFLNKGGNK